MKETKDDRVKKANEFIRVIAGCGRNFFKGRDGRTAAFYTKRGHIFFIDDGSRKKIYVMKNGPWCGFTHGSTMKVLIQTLVEYIRFGDKSNMGIGLCLEDVFSDSDPWGYGEAMREVRVAVRQIFDLPKPEVVPSIVPITKKSMPQTCCHCAHWKVETIDNLPPNLAAECDKLIGVFMNSGYICVSGPGGFESGDGDGGGVILLRTRSDFGCTLFEEVW